MSQMSTPPPLLSSQSHLLSIENMFVVFLSETMSNSCLFTRRSTKEVKITLKINNISRYH